MWLLMELLTTSYTGLTCWRAAREKYFEKGSIQLSLKYFNDLRSATANKTNFQFSLSRLPGAISTSLST